MNAPRKRPPEPAREDLLALLAERDRELATAREQSDAVSIENARLVDEARDAAEWQAATAEILKIIANSPSDLQRVFDAIAASAKRLLRGPAVTVTRRIDGMIHLAAFTPTTPAADAALAAAFPRPIATDPVVEHTKDGGVFQVTDIETDDPIGFREIARRRGWRSAVWAPLSRRGSVIGEMAVTRTEPGGFADHEIQLLQTFADQAVIAIENARLFDEALSRARELTEALEQQTATADVLKVISRSVFDLDMVLETLIDTAVRLARGNRGTIFLRQGEFLVARAFHRNVPDPIRGYLTTTTWRLDGDSQMAVAVREGRVVHVPDLSRSEMRSDKETRARAAFGAGLWAPLMRDGQAIGVFGVPRDEPIAFSDREIELVQTFADQAVIAIENTRLFEEVRAKTRDLGVALERQTATSEILRVISQSPTDAKPVFESIVAAAARLLHCDMAFVMLVDGKSWWNVATATPGGLGSLVLAEKFPVDPSVNFPSRAIVDKAMAYLPDWSKIDLPDHQQRVRDLYAINASLHLPFLQEGECVGVLTLLSRRAHAFSPAEIAQAESFRDQALIAIENARLFNETQEALQQQTATAEVLKVISRSAFDLDAVLDALIESARTLCDAPQGMLLMREGPVLRMTKQKGYPDEFERWVLANPQPPSPYSGVGRAALTGEIAHFPDVEADPDYRLSEGQRLGGYRALLSVPLLREKEAIGVFSLGRTTPGPFTDRQIELVRTFADQAVIAIENVRLFDEVQARTRDLSEALQQQTATSDVLKVISRSAFDLQAVFNTLVTSAVELGGAMTGTICVRDGEVYRYRETVGAEHTSALARYLRDHPAVPGRATIAGRVLLSGKVESIPDCLADPEYVVPMGALASNVRSLLGVPLLRKEGVEGAIILTRAEPGEFTARQIEIVQTFADQAVIALENVRLFDEVQSRTRELAASLDDLRKAQDRLVQSEKLASLGQLTAGIAHEIKNPLNFINNFSALSRELLDELREVLDHAPLDTAQRDEAEDIVGMVASNLDKVVHHGKRADSIVKNMLLHSREGSGERASVSINAMVEEALNLAYHGARAEKPGFNVTIEKMFDANADAADLYPQEMTRVLLNLLSNGFHATTKRKQTEDVAYEPTISASTRDLGDHVEIAIRDNGTGIPAEVKAKMFNPFFTTKPAGEGTGLGLSLSHDIVVKQHGGTIEVETAPGGFTRFIIRLPRGGKAK